MTRFERAVLAKAGPQTDLERHIWGAAFALALKDAEVEIGASVTPAALEAVGKANETLRWFRAASNASQGAIK